jgi:branched-chain amino acid transport system permease protein
VLFATVGGLGRTYGPALGALLLVPLGEVLRGKLG